ncbi:AMP-dependent synthetase [Pueribacillus theae]|uniref:AMP-dependent synthetase n=1 Tax=Pueribacillus theae TaxID=2171751 RepID=A0A2U1K5L6_9BACI|nr:AMP-binding protein [Pueribacillus theae]PWA12807.1 AMP-dependent synthetase [Pueribacillus theae]
MNEISVINRIAIGDILRRSAGRYPNKIALVEQDKQLTFKELDEISNQFANYLMSSGLKKGDRIATISTNSLEYVILSFGIAKAGLVWVPLNPGISLDEKRYILNQIDPKLLIGDAGLVKGIINELSEFCTNFLFIGSDVGESGNTFWSVIKGQEKIEPSVYIEDRDIAQIMYTSGTTGNPKGVMISHVAVYIASLGNIIEYESKPTDVVLMMMPYFHCAQHTFTTSALNIGAKTVIIKGFEPELLMKTINDEKITNMFGLPMMYRMLLDHPNRSKYDLSSLQKCTYAMAPMDRPTLERCINELNADFSLGTGQTEMYPATMMFKPDQQLQRFGSYWGVSSLINDTVILDDEGNIVPNGQIGEIVHRGPNVMSGYFMNEEATNESREYGWHHTGDLGYWDPDGQLVFVDRKKDVIKTGGENVASIKVEEAILSHGKVANAVAVGLPHEHWSEAVTAFVVPQPGESINEEEIIEHSKKHLGSFQVPKSVIILEELPMTTTGKIQKHILRNQYKDHYTQVKN